MSLQRGDQFKSLVKQAKEHEVILEKSPKVEKGSVEQAMTEKIELAQKQQDDLKCNGHIEVDRLISILYLAIGCEEHIARTDEELETVSAELEKWIHFRVSHCKIFLVLFFSGIHRMLSAIKMLLKLPL